MSFTKRQITVTMNLGQGSFGTSGANSVTLTGLRCAATISKAGGVGMSTLNLKIFGMSLDQMNALSQLKTPIATARANTIIVQAGDAATGIATVFTGTITESWPNMEGAPDVYLAISAFAGGLEAMKPVAPSSYSQPTDVVKIMAALAQTMGMGFINSGVSGMILPPRYYPGTARDQVKTAAQQAGINWLIDDGSPAQGAASSSGASASIPTSGLNVLVIWPRGTNRGGAVPLISKDTGMVGYPTVTQSGIVVKCEYNPSIAYGGAFKCQSILTVANGVWNIFNVTHELDSELPNGRWFTTVEGSGLGNVTPIPS